MLAEQFPSMAGDPARRKAGCQRQWSYWEASPQSSAHTETEGTPSANCAPHGQCQQDHISLVSRLPSVVCLNALRGTSVCVLLYSRRLTAREESALLTARALRRIG